MFHTETNAFTFPLTHTFTKDFSGLDNLALDLQFATDKTLTARKGPTPVFTRASSATRINEAGLIETAPENLILRSDDLTSASWTILNATVTGNTIVSPDGLVTADRLNEDSTASAHQVIQQAPTLTASQSYTFSIFAKAASHSSFQMVFSTAGFGGSTFANFVLTGAGSVGTSSGVTTKIEAYPNEWYRCSITISSVTGGTGGFVQCVANNNNSSSVRLLSYTGTNAQVVHLWGAQLEQYPSARTYIPTTTAAVYGARFDHDPITLACKGLLIEESRTNLALQSENHASATWSKTGVTVASATNTAPNGSTTSNLVSEDSSTGQHRVFQATSYVSGTSYSISCFFKYAGRQFVAITHPAVAANNLAIFDIQNGTISLSQSGVTTSITAYPNGWYRCVVNGVAATTASQSHIIQGSTTGGTLTGSYTGLNGAAFYIYGSQVEAGAFPTSYIPTTTASVVRSADICSITGSDFTSIWNGIDATVFFRGSRIAQQSGQTSWSLSSNTNATALNLIRGSTTELVTGAGASIGISVAGFTTSAEHKIAVAAKAGDYAASFNGATAVTSNNAFVLTLNKLQIGTNYPSNGQLNGWIHSMKFYKKRLPNAKLQTLTV